MCTGSEDNPVNNTAGTVSISRTGESKAQVLSNAAYNVTVNSLNEYEVTLTLPADPPSSGQHWQCACNATPGNPYQCKYTSQVPPSGDNDVNFFVKPANTAEAGWFQTLGGNFWASQHISTDIPATACGADPDCIPALIAPDPAGAVNSPGFPLVRSGQIVTSGTGDSYIHDTDTRDSSLGGKGLGVNVPAEGYLHFYSKFGENAETLPSASKPSVSPGLHTYRYSGDLTINETHAWNVANNEQFVVFVNGDLTIDDTAQAGNRITTVATGGTGFLMFVVSGDIIVTENVGHNSLTTDPTDPTSAVLEGVFVADGVFTILASDEPIITGGGNTVTRTFTNTGTTSWTAPDDVTSVEVLVVAGGGGAGGSIGGGGGGGGVIYESSYSVVPGNSYTVTVGNGGAGGAATAGGAGAKGGDSVFGSLTAVGGGGGSGQTSGAPTIGGSGGGSSNQDGINGAAGTSGQGYAGGNGLGAAPNYGGGGGGGAGGAGGNGSATSQGNGGVGLQFPQFASVGGSPAGWFGGGGAGGSYAGGSRGSGGTGGGGAGGAISGNSPGLAGVANTGGGGGSAFYTGSYIAGATGGSGIVIVRYETALEEDTESTLPNGLVSYWPLDEESGSTLSDATGPNNGTATGTSVVGGVLSNSRTFNGSTHFILVPDSSSLDINSGISLGGWVYLGSKSSGEGALISKSPWDGWPYYLAINQGNATVRFRTWQLSNTDLNTSQTLSRGAWHHVIATWDGSTKRIYINGSLSESVAATGTMSSTTGAVCLGSVANGSTCSTGTHILEGRLDEIGLWNRALTAFEVQTLYNGGNGLNPLTVSEDDGGEGEGITIGDRKFIGAGTFVGWSGVELLRSFDPGDDPTLNNTAPTETFVFRPDFIVNAPRIVKSAQMTWREIAPRFLESVTPPQQPP